MNTSHNDPPKVVKAWHERGRIFLELEGGSQTAFPVRSNPRLAAGSAAQLNDIEVSAYGLHWPQLDEDLSTAGILAGRYSAPAKPKRLANSGTRVRLQLKVSAATQRRLKSIARRRGVSVSAAVEELAAQA